MSRKVWGTNIKAEETTADLLEMLLKREADRQELHRCARIECKNWVENPCCNKADSQEYCSANCSAQDWSGVGE